MVETRKKPKTSEYIAPGNAYREFAEAGGDITEQQWKELEPTLGILVDAFEEVHWRMRVGYSGNRIEELRVLLADISSSRNGLRKDSGPGAAIWHAVGEMSKEEQLRLLMRVRNLTPSVGVGWR